MKGNSLITLSPHSRKLYLNRKNWTTKSHFVNVLKCLPTLDNSVTEGSSTSTNAGDLFKHIASTSPIYRHIADEQFGELSEQIVQEINKDWAFFPQLRFATSQMFAGYILLSGSTALMVNCVEPYGRLKSVDAHHERRTSSSIHQSSFPKSKSKYGQIEIASLMMTIQRS
ncbi:hypothetical protein BDF20DRAFT_832929 [Mycotypha africana]|uniref:uncharacterized protein n=1 Tax=Mycotypha africana TaxID=64632 RepID=UPI0022FFF86E|nr:uncharacterized protein BDF20DRAFT_832929 [Mycotypha africana]KAI8988046.1 hypothetical protein BDF20DRAFT_832929 [Mycotypha africana]